MKKYPKKVMTTDELIADYKNDGMVIPDKNVAKDAINEIGYYRLSGYSFNLLDPVTGKYQPGTTFDSVLDLYKFDASLRRILFDMTSRIEVSLRAHFSDSLLQAQATPNDNSQNSTSYNNADPLIYLDPSIFFDKGKFWQNSSSLSSEIARSKDVFITHNYENHDGQIPIWAAVEVMSFGTLSKYIKNLKIGKNSPYSYLAKWYTYSSTKGNNIVPNQEMLCSWIHVTVILRNMCAHNARIYNRAFSIKPKLLAMDKPKFLAMDAQEETPKYCGLYDLLLAMKYLRPSDQEWDNFTQQFCDLLNEYKDKIDLSKLHLPSDWKSHLNIQ